MGEKGANKMAFPTSFEVGGTAPPTTQSLSSAARIGSNCAAPCSSRSVLWSLAWRWRSTLVRSLLSVPYLPGVADKIQGNRPDTLLIPPKACFVTHEVLRFPFPYYYFLIPFFFCRQEKRRTKCAKRRFLHNREVAGNGSV